MLLKHWFDSMPLLIQRHVFETDSLIVSTAIKSKKWKSQCESIIAVWKSSLRVYKCSMPLYTHQLDLLELYPLTNFYNMLVVNIYCNQSSTAIIANK